MQDPSRNLIIQRTDTVPLQSIKTYMIYVVDINLRERILQNILIILENGSETH